MAAKRRLRNNPAMRCSEKVRLDPTRRTKPELRLLGDRVSRLWNAANYKCRQAFLAKTGVPVGATLEALMKDEPDYRQLPSDIAQEVLKKLSEAWKSYFELRQKWTGGKLKDKPGLPAYRKDRKTGERPFDLIPIKHSRSYSVDPRDAHIVLPRDRRRASGGGRLHVSYRGRVRFPGKMGRAEVTWDKVRRRWYMAWSVTVEDLKPREGGLRAAIDLGVRISVSLSVEGQPQALHFEAREALKDWDWLGREIAKEQAHIAGTRGPAREDRAPSSRAIARLHQLRRLRVEHAMRCMAKRIAEECDHLGVTQVFMGWPKNILRDVKYGSSAWAGRIHAFWSFDKVLGYLAAALGNFGIAAARVGERGSSSTCPTCNSGEVVRNPRWSLRCRSCGERMHSDQAGSRNILRQQVADAGFGEVPGADRDGLEASPRTVTLRWDTHLWRERFVNPGREGSLPEFSKAA